MPQKATLITDSWRAHSRTPASESSGHGGSPRIRTRAAGPVGDPVEELGARARRRRVEALRGRDVGAAGVGAESLAEGVGVDALDPGEDRLSGLDPGAHEGQCGIDEVVHRVVDQRVVEELPGLPGGLGLRSNQHPLTIRLPRKRHTTRTTSANARVGGEFPWIRPNGRVSPPRPWPRCAPATAARRPTRARASRGR